MSTVTASRHLTRVSRFYDSTIGKKAVMAVTGLILFGFLIAHMLGNLVNGVRVIQLSIAYFVAMVLVGMHLSHGIWSMFQSVGFSHPRYTPMIKTFAAVFSWLLIAGFVSVPLAVLTGLVR